MLLVAAVAVLSISALTTRPAFADTYDLIPTRGSGCNLAVGFSIQPIAAETYTIRVQGSANCPGTDPTVVVVCVEMRHPSTTYEPVVCGTGSSTGRASASVDFVCIPGATYRATITASDADDIDKARTGPITCPPLQPA